jgi:ribosomal protein S6--L-glutamate ligase
MADSPYLTFVYRPDDFDPGHLASAAERFFSAATQDAHRAGFRFRAIPHSDLVPGCGDRPHLWHHGTDLLTDQQLFQVDDFSWDPQACQHLKAICRTVRASDSILLNQHVGGPEHLLTDKLAIVQHAAGLGIPAPPTIAVPFGRYARTALPVIADRIGAGPYILKPRELGMGFSVLKAETAEHLTAAIDLAAQTGIGYIVQPYLPNSGDLRDFVIDRKLITSQHRRPTPGSYLANLSQGGTGTTEPRGTDTGEASLRIADSLDASCLYVDWLLTEDGPVLNEWQTGFGPHTTLPQPERAQLSRAYFDWTRRLLVHHGNPDARGEPSLSRP